MQFRDAVWVFFRTGRDVARELAERARAERDRGSFLQWRGLEAVATAALESMRWPAAQGGGGEGDDAEPARRDLN